MRLTDLLEQPSNTSYDSVSAAMNKRAQRQGLSSHAPELSGEGLYSKVYDQPKRTHEVLKVGRFAYDSPDHDGYYAYLQCIVGSDNPYFPQTSELKVLHNRKTGEPFFKVRIEKLEHLEELRQNELQALYHRIFGEEFEGHVDPEAISSRIGHIVKYGKHQFGNIDKQFLQALSLLNMMRKHGYNDDLSVRNLMIRRTPYGPQLVFTDPFTERKYNGS